MADVTAIDRDSAEEQGDAVADSGSRITGTFSQERSRHGLPS